MDKQSLFKRAVDTRACLDVLLKAQPGDTIPWTDFEKVTGSELNNIRANIGSARRIAEGDEYRMVFGTVRGVGLRRVANSGIPDTAQAIGEHIRRSANRGIRKLKCAEYDALQESDRCKLNTEMTILTIHQRAASAKVQRRIGAAVQQVQAQLPIGRALKVLGVMEGGDAGGLQEGEEDSEEVTPRLGV